MNTDLSKREMMLIWMALETEILRFDARLAKDGIHNHRKAYTTRCEMKVLSTRLRILMDAGKDGLDDLNETIKAIGRTSAGLAPFAKPQAD
jgi:hypothetical protein